MGKMLSLVLCATVLAGCGAKSEGVDRRWATDKKSVAPETGIDAMNDVDRFFYAHSFTTIASVPYGRCWPESLFKILSAGMEIRSGGRFVRFSVPKRRFKQNEGYAEWMRVKTVVIERATRRVVSVEGRAGPFADDAAVQAYLDSSAPRAQRLHCRAQGRIIQCRRRDAFCLRVEAWWKLHAAHSLARRIAHLPLVRRRRIGG